jgi:hypothetical protein
MVVTLLRKVGWSCIAFAFMALAQLCVALPGVIPLRLSTGPQRGHEHRSQGRLSAPKRSRAAFAD